MVAVIDRRRRTYRDAHNPELPLAALSRESYSPQRSAGWRYHEGARLTFNRAAAHELEGWEYVTLRYHRRGRCLVLERCERTDASRRMVHDSHGTRSVSVTRPLRAAGLAPWYGRLTIHVLTADAWAVGPIPRGDG